MAVASFRPVLAFRMVVDSFRILAASFGYCAEVARCIFAPLARAQPELDDGAFPELVHPVKPVGMPELDRAQREVAHALGVEGVDEFWISPDFALGIGDAKLDGKRIRFLAVGLGLLRALSPVELRAALGHEFGHARGGHMRLGRYVRHAIRMNVHAQLSFTRVSPAFWGSVLSLTVLRAIYLPWSRAKEMQADRAGSQIGGADALISTLRKLREVGPAHNASVKEIVRRSIAKRRGPLRLSEAAHALAAQLPASARKQASVEAEGDPLDIGGRTHPPVAVRIAVLGRIKTAPALHFEPQAMSAESLRLIDARLTPRWLARFGLRPELETELAIAAPEPGRGVSVLKPRLTDTELKVPTSDGLELDLDWKWKKPSA